MKIFTKLFAVFTFATIGFATTHLFADDKVDSLGTDNDEFSYQFNYNEFSGDGFKDFNLFDYLYQDRMPRIDVNYSLCNPAINSDYFSKKFAQTSSLEVTAGYTKNKLSKDGDLIKSTYNYLRFGFYSQNLGKKDDDKSKLQFDGWKFTWGDNTGYGWVISESADLTLFHGDNFNWTRLNMDSMPMPAKDLGRLDRFNNQIKFGRSFEGGVNLRLWNKLGISASYEQEQLFARHLFWYWTGSELIEAAVSGLTSEFIHDVTKRSKIGGPIINFIIKNGIAYGIYELRKKDMNWPFNTEAPMVIDKFKLGINFTF